MLRLIADNRKRPVPEAHEVERIRDLSELPEELARRVRAARGIQTGGGDAGSADVMHASPPAKEGTI